MTTERGGRPLKFESVDELKAKIEDYFNDCLPHPEEYTHYEYQQKDEIVKRRNSKGVMVDKTVQVDDLSKPPQAVQRWRVSRAKTPTVTGLAVFLDTSRRTLLDYEDGEGKDPEFSHTIKKAKDMIELHWENMLEGNSVAGVIFNLKNNFTWKDKTESEITNPDHSLNPLNGLSVDELRKLAKSRSQ